MIRITVPDKEWWDDKNEEFVYSRGCTLQLEHSLVSLSKWESKYCKPFLTKEDKSVSEMVDYIRCMTLTQNVPSNVYNNISDANFKEIEKYIESPMTATFFGQEAYRGSSGEQVTAELIYYWMITLNIPFECQKWHINRLLTLIEVASNLYASSVFEK